MVNCSKEINKENKSNVYNNKTINDNEKKFYITLNNKVNKNQG